MARAPPPGLYLRQVPLHNYCETVGGQLLTPPAVSNHGWAAFLVLIVMANSFVCSVASNQLIVPQLTWPTAPRTPQADHENLACVRRRRDTVPVGRSREALLKWRPMLLRSHASSPRT